LVSLRSLYGCWPSFTFSSKLLFFYCVLLCRWFYSVLLSVKVFLFISLCVCVCVCVCLCVCVCVSGKRIFTLLYSSSRSSSLYLSATTCQCRSSPPVT